MIACMISLFTSQSPYKIAMANVKDILEQGYESWVGVHTQFNAASFQTDHLGQTLSTMAERWDKAGKPEPLQRPRHALLAGESFKYGKLKVELNRKKVNQSTVASDCEIELTSELTGFRK